MQGNFSRLNRRDPFQLHHHNLHLPFASWTPYLSQRDSFDPRDVSNTADQRQIGSPPPHPAPRQPPRVGLATSPTHPRTSCLPRPHLNAANTTGTKLLRKPPHVPPHPPPKQWPRSPRPRRPRPSPHPASRSRPTAKTTTLTPTPTCRPPRRRPPRAPRP